MERFTPGVACTLWTMGAAAVVALVPAGGRTAGVVGRTERVAAVGRGINAVRSISSTDIRHSARVAGVLAVLKLMAWAAWRLLDISIGAQAAAQVSSSMEDAQMRDMRSRAKISD